MIFHYIGLLWINIDSLLSYINMILYMYERVLIMENKAQKLEMLNQEFNGHFTSSDLSSQGFTKYDISQFVKKGLLERVSRGKYLYKDTLDDEFKLVQQNNSKMIFSNETALYLHNMTGRFPSKFTVTTESGYHLRNSNLKVYYVKPEILYLGTIEIENHFRNKIIVYDKERTICDIIKNKNRIEMQVYLEGLRSYFLNGKPNLKKLSFYAGEMGISQKVMDVALLFSIP